MCFIVLGIVLAIVLLILLAVYLRKKWACRKVRCMSCPEKKEKLDKALTPFGFRYEVQGDFIVSDMYPWQREMGYCRQYDEAAPAMNIIVDCEPVCFFYRGKHWLIELWKGQYGCTTGAEVGIYVNDSAQRTANPEKLFYECASDEERLPMQFLLYKNKRVIMERSGVHWWLTGFLMGETSEPEELEMEVRISFPDIAMRNAFYNGLLRAGYSSYDVRMENLQVRWWFLRPCTVQPKEYGKRYRKWVMWCNRKYAALYCRLTGKFSTHLDRISFLGYCFPCLYRLLIRLGTGSSRRKLDRYRRKQERNIRKGKL